MLISDSVTVVDMFWQFVCTLCSQAERFATETVVACRSCSDMSGSEIRLAVGWQDLSLFVVFVGYKIPVLVSVGGDCLID